MEYLLKASAVIAIFYILYKLLLQRETFFQTNRGYLLVGLLTSILVPLIVIPIYIEYTPTKVETTLANMVSSSVVSSNVANTSSEIPFDWLGLTYTIYILGVIFFLGKLCIEFTSLKFLLKKHKFTKSGPYTFIETEDDLPPFSFFHWVVFNPKKYTHDELQHILNHEKVHASEWHSIDIMLTQLACVLFWFNPFIWLYKKEIQQNLEFIADKKAQDFSNCEKSYQLILLKASVPGHQFLIANNFYNSQIKKRIIMLHKSKSKKVNAWKYSLTLPVLALFLMSFNTKEVLVPISDANLDTNGTAYSETTTNLSAENETNTPKATTTSTSKKELSVFIIDKKATDEELDRIKADLKKLGVTVKFKSIKRNKDGEITAIKIDAKAKNSSASYNQDSDKAISPIKLAYDSDNGNLVIGNRNSTTSYVYETVKGGNYKVRKSGKGSTLVITEEIDNDVDVEHTSKVVIRQNGKKDNVTTYRKSKKMEVITGDDGLMEVIVEEESGNNNDIVIVNGKIVDTAESNIEVIVEEKGKNVRVNDEDMIIIEDKDSDNNSIYISGFQGKKPLLIVDGKEMPENTFEKIGSNNIESVTVLKDESAIKKYGEKGKNGVVIIKTKKKKN